MYLYLHIFYYYILLFIKQTKELVLVEQTCKYLNTVNTYTHHLQC